MNVMSVIQEENMVQEDARLSYLIISPERLKSKDSHQIPPNKS